MAIIFSVIGLILHWIRYRFEKRKEEGRKPRLVVMLKESIHGHPSKEDSRMKIRPHALITNIGEHPTTIFEVQFYGVSLLNEIVQGGALFELKSPIRINGKDTIHFKEEIFVAGLFPKNDCILNMTVFFAGGTATSNKTVSTYHEILPLRFTEHKKPAI